jgi:hypothetical protein
MLQLKIQNSLVLEILLLHETSVLGPYERSSTTFSSELFKSNLKDPSEKRTKQELLREGVAATQFKLKL